MLETGCRDPKDSVRQGKACKSFEPAGTDDVLQQTTIRRNVSSASCLFSLGKEAEYHNTQAVKTARGYDRS